MDKRPQDRPWKNWPLYVLALSLASLSGCAGIPQVPDCPKPLPAPAEFLKPLPPPGYFRQRGEEILKRGQTSAPSFAPSGMRPTSFSPNAAELSDFSLAELF
jgi:hypothetical protein